MARLSVMLADDSELMLSAVRQLLEPEFDVAGTVSRGDEVVESAEVLEPDVIVLDISMPGISGIEAAQRLRERGCESAIVFLSVHRQRGLVEEALRTSGSGYVVKSRAGAELIQAIHTVVSGMSFQSPSLSGSPK